MGMENSPSKNIINSKKNMVLSLLFSQLYYYHHDKIIIMSIFLAILNVLGLARSIFLFYFFLRSDRDTHSNILEQFNSKLTF